jgi:hypothetical protein
MIWEPCRYSTQEARERTVAKILAAFLGTVKSVRGTSHPKIDTSDLSTRAARLRHTLWRHTFPDSNEKCVTEGPLIGNRSAPTGFWPVSSSAWRPGLRPPPE